MELKFPKEFDFYLKDHSTRAAFVSENAQIKPTDCPNCGGVGFMYIFVATGGPFREVTGTKINHWTREGWYTGETHSAVCPVCKAQEYHEAYQDGKIDPKVADADRILLDRWDLEK
jgi:hypothetical protein